MLILPVAVLAMSTIAPRTANAQTPPGSFTSTPVYSSGGLALVVFTGGTTEQLENAARGANASGAWIQDRSGNYQLLVVGGPNFLKDVLRTAFPSGFLGATAVTLTR